MRSLVIVACLALVPACGGSSSSKSDAAVEQDLSAMTSDLAVPQSCAQIYACTTGANTPQQIGTCAAAGTSTASTAFMALYECALSQCMVADGGASVDGGAGSCTTVTDDTAACNDCVQNAEASAACSSALTACENGG